MPSARRENQEVGFVRHLWIFLAIFCLPVSVVAERPPDAEGNDDLELRGDGAGLYTHLLSKGKPYYDTVLTRSPSASNRGLGA